MLPLPLVVYWLTPRYTTTRSAIKVPFFQELNQVLNVKLDKGVTVEKPLLWQRAFIVICWSLVVLALTKPMLVGAPQIREEYGRDVMVIVDLSGSMNTPDFIDDQGKKVTRLQAVKSVLKTFATKRKGDRLGLILFGDSAFLQSPFTADHKAWLLLLNEAQIPMAGQSTHLGDAIGLGIKVLTEGDQQSSKTEKLAIVLTDGNDTDSFVAPLDAAKVAQAKGVKIHMIAMGNPKTVGESALDMETISQVAKLSGGQAFQALDKDQLEQSYETINELEPQLYRSTTYRPKLSLHAYLVMIALVLALGVYSWSTVKQIRQHRQLITKQEKGNHKEDHRV
nr:VWA domain-containing protein [Vibrio casei]